MEFVIKRRELFLEAELIKPNCKYRITSDTRQLSGMCLHSAKSRNDFIR
jgi:hypothetical protein